MFYLFPFTSLTPINSQKGNPSFLLSLSLQATWASRNLGILAPTNGSIVAHCIKHPVEISKVYPLAGQRRQNADEKVKFSGKGVPQKGTKPPQKRERFLNSKNINIVLL